MTSPSNRDEQLARLIGDTLRAQPLRHAPSTLESRVLRQIQARATTPWWQMKFARWPLAVQAVFLVACAGMVKLAIDVSIWLTRGVEVAPVTTEVISAVRPMKTSVQAIVEVTAMLVEHIPSLWVYGCIAALAALYATLFGISAAAYRTLYANR